MYKKLIIITILLTFTNSFHFHFNIKPIGNLFKKIYNKIKNPITKFIHKEKQKIKTDIISLLKKIKNLGPKFEKIKNDLKRNITFFKNLSNIDELKKMKKKNFVINSQIIILKEKLDYMRNYPNMIKIYKSKNWQLRNMINSLKKQIDIKILQKKNIDVKIQKFLDDLKKIQDREIVSENLEKEVERNLEEILSKQKKIDIYQKKNHDKINEFAKNLENSKKIISDLKKKILLLEKEENEMKKKNHEKEIRKKSENLEKIKVNLKKEEISKNQEDLQNLQKTQLDNIKNIKIMEDGINELENKKKDDMRVFKFNVDNQPFINEESEDFMKSMKDIADSYLSAED